MQADAAAKPALSPAQLDELRRELLEKRTHLLRAHEERSREAAAVQVEGVDLEDIAEGVIEDRERAALEEHDRAELHEVELALAKMEAGTYGLSEATGRPIPFARLRALPWARS